MTRKISKLNGLILLSALATLPVRAITIQDASTPGYVTSSSSFTGVAKILFNETGNSGTFICSGALIASNYLLTAGHCVSGAANWSVTFQTASGNTTIAAANTYLEPDFAPYPDDGGLAGLDQYDVAVIQLAQAAPADATIYGIDTTFSDIVFGSTVLDLVGYGFGGNPTVGILNTGVRRSAQQVIQYAADLLNGVATPDHPLIMTMAFGESTPASYGLDNGGDSGGPALFGNLIVGLSDFGNLPRSGNYESGVEYLTGHASLADPSIGAFVTQFVAAPEPGTNALIAAGLAAILIWKRRSRCA